MLVTQSYRVQGVLVDDSTLLALDSGAVSVDLFVHPRALPAGELVRAGVVRVVHEVADGVFPHLAGAYRGGPPRARGPAG